MVGVALMEIGGGQRYAASAAALVGALVAGLAVVRAHAAARPVALLAAMAVGLLMSRRVERVWAGAFAGLARAGAVLLVREPGPGIVGPVTSWAVVFRWERVWQALPVTLPLAALTAGLCRRRLASRSPRHPSCP